MDTPSGAPAYSLVLLGIIVLYESYPVALIMLPISFAIGLWRKTFLVIVLATLLSTFIIVIFDNYSGQGSFFNREWEDVSLNTLFYAVWQLVPNTLSYLLGFLIARMAARFKPS